MDHDLLSSVAAITDQLRQSQALLRHLRLRAREVREGADESGSITIVIDDEGMARDVRVATDWRRRLVPAHVGAAVVAADTEAAKRRAATTVDALASGLSTQDCPPGHDEPSPVQEPPPVQEPVQEPARRSVGELSAALFAAVDDLDRLAEPEPEVHGTGARGAVRVRMAQGRITGCTVDEAWLAHQDEITLAHGLREAVSAAASAAVAVRAPIVEYQERLRSLVAQAQAFLADGPAEGAR